MSHMTSIWPDITAGSRPDQAPTLNSIGMPAHLNVARTNSASRPTRLLKSFGSRTLNGGLSPSWPTLIVLPARLGYLAASLSGSHFGSAANAGAAFTISMLANPRPTNEAAMPFMRFMGLLLSRSGGIAHSNTVTIKPIRSGGLAVRPSRFPQGPCHARQHRSAPRSDGGFARQHGRYGSTRRPDGDRKA